MGFFGGKFDVNGKLVVITGGSQGLGAELAKKVYSQGANVIIIARTETKLKKTVGLIETFKVNDNQYIEYRAGDLSKYEDCERIIHSIEQSPDIVFFCAGSSLPKLFIDLTPREVQQGVDVNYNASVNFAHVTLRNMVKVKPDYTRHFVFCSSILAVFSFIGYGQYAPLKAALRSLADVLRHEALAYNIKVHTIFAGNFESEGFIEENKTKPEITKIIEGPSAAISTEAAADKVLWYLDHGYETIFTDFIGWVLSSGMLGFSPRFFGGFQALLAFLLAIITPIYNISIRHQIKAYFKENTKKE